MAGRRLRRTEVFPGPARWARERVPETCPEDEMAKPRTLYDKIWDDHVVDCQPDGTCLLYIDRHLVHEVTSPQAFEGLRHTGRKVRRPELTFATVDHNIPTDADRLNVADPLSLQQIQTL